VLGGHLAETRPIETVELRDGKVGGYKRRGFLAIEPDTTQQQTSLGVMSDRIGRGVHAFSTIVRRRSPLQTGRA
jgi:hypothetical protein